VTEVSAGTRRRTRRSVLLRLRGVCRHAAAVRLRYDPFWSHALGEGAAPTLRPTWDCGPAPS